ncbi:MAG TPA: protein-glutamate O-methyltransferase CheR [Dongiaceae bacterium]|nr:protein-glutamate O-methyltransferase CheR [Dongiaceae bacterium]
MTHATVQPAIAIDSPPDPELVRIRDLIYQVTGIFHPDTKLRLLADRCIRRMQEIKAESFREYFEQLTIKATRQTELVALLNEITIGETSFFRNHPQLEALRQIIIPKIVSAKAHLTVRHLRIWSAGCSTGEEPYTLSMVLQEEAELLKGWNTEILATDLNERSLFHAQKGLYGSYSTRHVTRHYLDRYFLRAGGQLQVTPAVQSAVTFSRLNLCDDARITFMKGMDLIFCCNVLIYFDIASKQRVIEHFYSNLLPHGYLFLGQTESLYGVNDKFRLMHLPGARAYVRGDDPAATGEGV